MICLNFDIYKDLCQKHHLEPIAPDLIQWGIDTEDGMIPLTTFSPSYGVKINIPDEYGRYWWVVGVFLMQRLKKDLINYLKNLNY